MKIREILIIAAEELEANPKRWSGHPLTDPYNCDCAWSIFFDLSEKYEIEFLLLRALGTEPYGLTVPSPIWEWNDRPERVVEDIIALYRKAAELTNE